MKECSPAIGTIDPGSLIIFVGNALQARLKNKNREAKPAPSVNQNDGIKSRVTSIASPGRNNFRETGPYLTP